MEKNIVRKNVKNTYSLVLISTFCNNRQLISYIKYGLGNTIEIRLLLKKTFIGIETSGLFKCTLTLTMAVVLTQKLLSTYWIS
jgi:hypothetical protein